jgi:hypothetical protein
MQHYDFIDGPSACNTKLVARHRIWRTDMIPVPDLPDPPRFDSKMLNEVGFEAGMYDGDVVGGPEGCRFQSAEASSQGAGTKSGFRGATAVHIVD